MSMIVRNKNTGAVVEPGTPLILKARHWDEEDQVFTLEAGCNYTVPGKSGKVRLTSAQGDNTYLYAHLFDLVVEPNGGYLATAGQSDVGVLIYGRSITAKDADRIARQLMPGKGVKLAESNKIGDRMVERVYN